MYTSIKKLCCDVKAILAVYKFKILFLRLRGLVIRNTAAFP